MMRINTQKTATAITGRTMLTKPKSPVPDVIHDEYRAHVHGGNKIVDDRYPFGTDAKPGECVARGDKKHLRREPAKKHKEGAPSFEQHAHAQVRAGDTAA
jgi:hypothetical protein